MNEASFTVYNHLNSIDYYEVEVSSKMPLNGP